MSDLEDRMEDVPVALEEDEDRLEYNGLWENSTSPYPKCAKLYPIMSGTLIPLLKVERPFSNMNYTCLISYVYR